MWCITRSRAALPAGYLDELGVSHVDGRVEESPDAPLDADLVTRAADAVRGPFPPTTWRAIWWRTPWS